MGTFTDKTIIDRLVQNGGYYDLRDKDAPDNPPAILIVQYTGQGGNVCYGVIFKGERVDLTKYLIETAYVQNPILYWSHPQWVTVHTLTGKALQIERHDF